MCARIFGFHVDVTYVLVAQSLKLKFSRLLSYRQKLKFHARLKLSGVFLNFLVAITAKQSPIKFQWWHFEMGENTNKNPRTRGSPVDWCPICPCWVDTEGSYNKCQASALTFGKKLNSSQPSIKMLYRDVAIRR